MNGKRMENARQFEVNLYRRPMREKVTLSLLRGLETLTVQVSVIEQENDPQRFADLVHPEKNMIARLGILGIEIDKRVAELLPEMRKPYGVVVAARVADAPFGSSALQPGDVIHELNGVPMSSIDALRDALGKLKSGDALVLQLERDGRLRFLSLELE